MGMTKASATPDSVECTPDLKTSSQSATPPSEIDPQRAHAEAAHGPERRKQDARHRQRPQVEAARIEQGDDDDRAEVVDNRQRGQEHLERNRHPVAEHAEHGQRKGNVGRDRHGPAAHDEAVVVVERREDHRRHDHAAEGGQSGGRHTVERGQLAAGHLAPQLEADEQEEYGHQPVIDPNMQGLRTELQPQHGFVRRGGE